MIIRARAPLRLGLAGGGTDIASYSDLYGGCVLNATIDRYAYAVIKILNQPTVRFTALDQVKEIVLGEAQEGDTDLLLHRAVYEHMINTYNEGKPIYMELSTFCDAPVGSGLGASSTLVVAMIRAFTELLNLALDDYAIAHLAYTIERLHCGFQGGKQDQYSATFGGFNFIEFYAMDRVLVNTLRLKNWILCELEASLILFFTGVSRESAKIITDQSDLIKSSSPEALEAMHGIKQEAVMMKECILRGDFKGIAESMQIGWENKKRTAKSVSNPLIDEIYAEAINAGALAGKISGAGGGGFMLFFVPAERRLDVIRCLNRFEGHISNCHFTKHGSQAWRV